MNASIKTVSICFLSLFLCTVIGCGSGKSVSGKYVGDIGTVEFKDGGKATVTIGGTAVESAYVINGNKVNVTPASGMTSPLSFTINDDGSLTGADGSPFKKK